MYCNCLCVRNKKLKKNKNKIKKKDLLAYVRFTFANKIEATHERSLVSAKVELLV